MERVVYNERYIFTMYDDDDAPVISGSAGAGAWDDVRKSLARLLVYDYLRSLDKRDSPVV